jgi:probable phosphoglycerate mutase
MAWGDWESRSLAELRAELGAAMAQNEARGLDFRPTGGESPRDVQNRLGPWLAGVGRTGRSIAAVTHKGVIRAILGLATGWNFLGKPPVRLENDTVQLFSILSDGRPRILQPNIKLLAR